MNLNKLAEYYWFNGMNHYDEGTNGVYQFFQKRSIPEPFINHYQYGYSSPDGDIAELKKLYDRETLLRLGLIRTNDKGQDYAFFRDRIMFPIRDYEGDVIAFSARRLDGEKEWKYINSVDSDMYTKGHVLYGLYESRKAIAQKGYCVVVEGNLDRDRCHLFGIDNVVAPCGTAITKEHLETLFTISNSVYLLLDGDRGGRESAQRTTDMCHEYFPKYVKRLKVATLPDGYDPDKYLLSFDTELAVLKVNLLLKQAKVLPKTVVELIKYEPTEHNIFKSYDNSDVEAILNSIDIVQVVIGNGVELRRSGVVYRARCPFHDEKTASFMVSPTKQIFKCFGCGKGGNAIEFLKLKKGWSFKECLNYLKG